MLPRRNGPYAIGDASGSASSSESWCPCLTLAASQTSASPPPPLWISPHRGTAGSFGAGGAGSTANARAATPPYSSPAFFFPCSTRRLGSAELSSAASGSPTPTQSWELMDTTDAGAVPFARASPLRGTPGEVPREEEADGSEDDSPPDVPSTRLLRPWLRGDDELGQTRDRPTGSPCPHGAVSLASSSRRSGMRLSLPMSRSGGARLPKALSTVSQEWSLISTPEELSPLPSRAPAFLTPAASGVVHRQLPRTPSRGSGPRVMGALRRSPASASRAYLPRRPPPSFTHVLSTPSMGSFEEIRMEDVLGVAPASPSPAPSPPPLASVWEEPAREEEAGSPSPSGPTDDLPTAANEPRAAAWEPVGPLAEAVSATKEFVTLALHAICTDLPQHWYTQLRVVLGKQPPVSSVASAQRRRRRGGRKQEKQTRRGQWLSPRAQCLRCVTGVGARASPDDHPDTRSGTAPTPANSLWHKPLGLTADVLACAIHSVLLFLI